MTKCQFKECFDRTRKFNEEARHNSFHDQGQKNIILLLRGDKMLHEATPTKGEAVIAFSPLARETGQGPSNCQQCPFHQER